MKKRPNLDVICRAMSTRIASRGNGPSRFATPRTRARHRAWANESFRAVALSIRLRCCNCRGWAMPTILRVWGLMWSTTCPVWEKTCRTTWKCTSSMLYPTGLHVSRHAVVEQTLGGLPMALPPKRRGGLNHFGPEDSSKQRGRKCPNLNSRPQPVRYDGSSPSGGHGYRVHVGPMNSESRGSVKIKSTNPKEHPALRFNYLSEPEDRREWVEAVRTARHIYGTTGHESI